MGCLRPGKTPHPQPTLCLPRPAVPPWVVQELERKSEAFSAERRKATDTILDLQRRLAEAESTAQRLQAEQGRLTSKLETQRAAAEDASAKLRGVREEAAVRIEQYEKELGMAQRMAQLYRESKEERAAKCTELEGVVQELKAHMEVGGGLAGCVCGRVWRGRVRVRGGSNWKK